MTTILLVLPISAWWTMMMVSTARYCDSISPGMWDVSNLPPCWKLWCAFGLLILWPLYLATALCIYTERSQG